MPLFFSLYQAYKYWVFSGTSMRTIDTNKDQTILDHTIQRSKSEQLNFTSAGKLPYLA